MTEPVEKVIADDLRIMRSRVIDLNGPNKIDWLQMEKDIRIALRAWKAGLVDDLNCIYLVSNTLGHHTARGYEISYLEADKPEGWV
ncbi:hypothetical protein LCGC14_1237500 [marine sediment metagenome]|uniref:Uncharacterized protein n=1 Tax=marine sediment metagenome TaxID=412755 RepID=A0A0F9NP06_9ZZZZ